MDRDTLLDLEHLNQLSLTSQEQDDMLAFFSAREADWETLAQIDTETVERMVHVRPMVNVMREDVAAQPFSRDDLLAQAPESMDGYWQVPQVLQ
ncbi:MAG: Asp-tRNA(Asn)/Glu-tRNA(Gln) amidotransferase subunit GatC [Eggerthellaceae bacterium]|nr:Asp-tRNA(Asn)/Glu-tRNA(Gln) amidotransferase subunit GatC [Eggerthellaceae bacterium]